MKDSSRVLQAAFFFSLAAITITATIFSTCSKNPGSPSPIAPPDTVVVVDTFFVKTDTVFSTCEIVDLTIRFTVTGDQSAPNVYAYFVNGVERGRFIVSETFPEVTEITFDVEFLGIVFGDVITIRKIEGSRAESIGSSIIGIECSG